jgi:hypothetical protein
MKRLRWQFVVGLLAALLLAAAPVSFADTNNRSAVPGTLNYVEGQVSIGSEFLNAKSVGSTQLDVGQSVTTSNGKTEVLLTPGVFLRLGNHSSAQMVSSSLTDTEVAVQEGEAMVEVDQLYPQNNIQIQQQGGTTRLLKTGLYDFDATHNLVRVVDGKAVVRENDHDVTVKGGHELALNMASKPKTEKFDKKNFEATDLYRWSSLRSDYLAQANVDAARTYFVNGFYGPGWFGAGWYWDPWFADYTFIPGDGIFYNPFGWGFYSPFWAYRAPLYYGGYYGYGYHYFGNRPVRVGRDPAPYRNQSFHSAPAFAGNRGFAGGPGGGFHGEGFHGGGFRSGGFAASGFHGGGFSGGGFGGHH